jgi:glutathione peroxidase-family protein
MVELGSSFFEFEAHDIDGKQVDMRQLCKNAKAILVVNVASA